MTVRVSIESECPKVRELAADLTEIASFDELLGRSLPETRTAQLAAKHRLHVTCAVPLGVLRAAESAARLALPSTCTIELAAAE